MKTCEDNAFRALFEKSPVPMWVRDEASSRVLEANEAAVALLGYRREELLELSAEAIGPAVPGPARLKLRDGRDARADLCVREIDFRGRPARIVAVRLFDESPPPGDREDGENLVAIAAHDLQEPLRMVSSFLKLFRRRSGGLLDVDSEAFIGFASLGADRMKRLLDDLVIYTLAGGTRFREVSVDCAEAVAAALRNLRREIDDSKARICVGLMPIVTGDPSHLVQLFQRLVENAIHFRRHGEVCEIRIECEIRRAEWLFAVIDNGSGFDMRFAEEVFHPFRPQHVREEGGGSGLGLAICRRIVARHRGRIWATTSPGGGTTLQFTLPA